MTLRRWLVGVFRRDTRPLPPPRDGQDDGTGVLVPAGPRPLRGGAHARPPVPDTEQPEPTP
ncbi:hypothetical protein GCM10010840_32290 [Deinococcus aerolatus]|uniref:Uncharacterized protein n=1 Tax=Deinococcus aerolatus TaxID=522487 RepID=A0ABQ2GEP3_9DEIO|nr:hypothetical protein GCM10010840_32290 [Deinococcus aerolatus]